MNSQKQLHLLGILPSGLQEQAVDLSDLAGVQEYAFPLAVAADVIQHALTAGLVPLGGDLWERDGNEFQFGDDGWFANVSDIPGQEERVEAVRRAAGSFLARLVERSDAFVTLVV